MFLPPTLRYIHIYLTYISCQLKEMQNLKVENYVFFGGQN